MLSSYMHSYAMHEYERKVFCDCIYSITQKDYNAIARSSKLVCNVNRYTDLGDTLLHKIVDRQWTQANHFEDNVHIVQFLIQCGANVHKKNLWGLTPLHVYACAQHLLNQTECMQVLLNAGANINARDNEDMTPLHRAVQVGCLETVNYLLVNKADVHVRDRQGNTPLHNAILSNARYGTMITTLLLDYNANVQERNNTGDTPLHIAARVQAVDILSMLLAAGADQCAKNSQGKTFKEIMIECQAASLAPVLEQMSKLCV